MKTPTRATKAARSARGAGGRCPSQATVESLPISKAEPMQTTGQTAPEKMAVKPLIAKPPEHAASASAAHSVTAVTVRRGVTVRVTADDVTAAVTAEPFRLAAVA